MNKVILIGHLGSDPEVRYTPNGLAICNLSLATSRNWKNKDTGERQEETEWHRVVLYDRLAEIAEEYLRKGSLVYIEGRLKTRKWADKDGVEKYTTEVIAAELTMLGGRSQAGDEDAAAGARGRSTHPASRADRAPASANPYAEARSGRAPARAPAPPASSSGFDDDDVPF